MHEELIQKYMLEPYKEQIVSVRKACLVGMPCRNGEEVSSYFGGLPVVDEDFVWPEKDGFPLHFIAQLHCSDLDIPSLREGHLLFFYDARHWGSSPNDIGHARVLHQLGEITLTPADLPHLSRKRFFGLLTQHVSPPMYTKVCVTFHQGISYPGEERELLSFKNDDWEGYSEFIAELHHEIQVGGYPYPLQNDFMEDECINAFQFGTRDEWCLLAQMFEIGDMQWGDAGALYWFIHRDDLAAGRVDRIWMVTQCH